MYETRVRQQKQELNQAQEVQRQLQQQVRILPHCSHSCCKFVHALTVGCLLTRCVPLLLQLQEYGQRTQELSSDLNLNVERNKQNLHDFSRKEEELVVAKVELSNLHEKYKSKFDEVRVV